jgi:NarL family two-component system response regulator LiaR
MYEDPFLVRNAIDAGAGAYIAKSAEIREIIAALDAVLSGKTRINPSCEIPARTRLSAGLPPREREIVSLVKQHLGVCCTSRIK